MKLAKDNSAADENKTAAAPQTPETQTPAPSPEAQTPAPTQAQTPPSSPQTATPPPTPTPTPAPAPESANAETPSPEGEEEGEEEGDAKAKANRHIAAVLAFFKKGLKSKYFPAFRKYAIIAVLLFGTPFVAYKLFYTDLLISFASQSVKNGDYATALEEIELYENFNDRTPESLRILARIWMFSGDYQSLATIADYVGDDPEMLMMKAVGTYLGAPEDAAEAESRIAIQEMSRRKSPKFPYIHAAEIIFNMLNGEWIEVDALATADDATDPKTNEGQINRQHMNALYDLYVNTNKLTLNTQPALPFASIKETTNPFAFPIDVTGFNNTYFLPLTPSFIGRDAIKTNNINDMYYGLYMLAKVAGGAASPEIMTPIILRLHSGSSLLSRYVAAYYLATAGEYDRVAEFYRDISEKSENSYVRTAEASAIWANSGGGAPDDGMWTAIRRALTLDPNNLQAITNAAFWEMHYGDLEEADRLIQRAAAISSVNPFVVVNRLILLTKDLDVNWLKEELNIASLLASYPFSDTIHNIAVLAETEKGSHIEAIQSLSRIRDLHPDDPLIPMKIADRHRYLGQVFLGARELKTAYDKIPDNQDLAGQLAVYRAMNNDEKTAEAIAILDPTSDYAMHATAIWESIKDADNAKEIGNRALEISPPNRRSAIAVDMTRIYLNADDRLEDAEYYLNIAKENAELAATVYFGLNETLTALDYRLRAEKGENIPEETATELEAAIRREDVFSQIDLASSLIRMGHASKAVKLLEELRGQRRLGNLRPTNLLIALIRGYEALGETNKIAEIERSIANIKAGKIKAETEGFVGAKTVSSKDVVLTKGSGAIAQANDLIKKRDYKGAIDIFTALLENDGEELQKPALTFQNRGVLFMKVRQYGEAARDFATALSMRDQLKPNEYNAVHYNYINALARDGDYNQLKTEVNERLAEVRKSGKKFAQEKIYLQILAAGLINSGKHSEAVRVYEELLELYPRDISTYNLLSDALVVLERFDRAISVLSKGLEIDHQNLEMHERLLRIYRQLGDSTNLRLQSQVIEDIKSRN